jgi:hypothetical protein
LAASGLYGYALETATTEGIVERRAGKMTLLK